MNVSTIQSRKRLPELGFLVSALLLLFSIQACDKAQPNAKKEKIKDPRSIATALRSSGSDVKSLRSIQRRVMDAKDDGSAVSGLSELESKLNGMTSQELLDLVANLDPKANKEDYGVLLKALRRLAQTDVYVALEAIQKAPPGYSSMNFYETLAKTDPAGVSRWLGEKGLDKKLGEIPFQCAMELAKRSPEAAMSLLKGSSPELRNHLLSTVFAELGKTDLPKAMEMAAAMSPELQNKAIESALRGGAIKDPDSAFVELAKLGDSAVANKVYPTLFSQWFQSDSWAAGRALEQVSPAIVQQVLMARNGALAKMMSTDPDQALKVLGKLVFTESNSAIFMQAAEQLGSRDANKALSWIQGFPDSPRKGDLMRQITLAQAGDDPAAAASGLLASATGYRPQVIAGLAAAWGKKDPQSAMRFIPNLSPAEQEIFVSEMLNASIPADVAGTAKILVESQIPPSVRGSGNFLATVRSAAAAYAASDPAEAAKWTNSFSTTVEKEAAASGVAARWAESDPTATAEWVGGLPSGSIRDAAVDSLIRQIKKTDPESAEQWRKTLSK